MVVCGRCKQSSNFTVKDSLQICGRCGATTTIASLQTEDFKGLKYRKHYISEKRQKRSVQEKNSKVHVEKHWGVYLEAFQRALRENVRILQAKLHLDDTFSEKVKYFWFEYLNVFSSNQLPLLAFFTTVRQGGSNSNASSNSIRDQSQTVPIVTASRSVMESRYRQKFTKVSKHLAAAAGTTSADNQIIEEEDCSESENVNAGDFYETDFIEKILKQKSTQDQQTQILKENEDLGDIFSLFDTCVDEIMADSRQKRNNNQQIVSQPVQGTNHPAFSTTSIQTRQQSRKSSHLPQQQISAENAMNLEKSVNKRKRRAKGRLNYIENKQECGKNYLLLMLDRSEDYVRSLYNGFRSGYLHMLYLQDPERNPLKRIKKAKESSKGYSISKVFVSSQIERRNIPFARDFAKIDIFHLIWAWDWALFIENNSTLVFQAKDDGIRELYEYLKSSLAQITKQVKEFQSINAEISKSRNLLNKTKKSSEIKLKLNQAKVKQNIKKAAAAKNGYLSGDDDNDKILPAFTNSDSSEIDQTTTFITTTHTSGNGLLQDDDNQDLLSSKRSLSAKKRKATPRLIATAKNSRDIDIIHLDNKVISDEREEQEKAMEELEYQQQRLFSKRVFALDEEQLQTLAVIIEEILKENELLESRRMQKPLFAKKIQPSIITAEDNPTVSSIIPLEYNLIPTIIYLALNSMSEAYTPREVHNWLKKGFFPYNLGIAPFIKIADPLSFWLTPPSVPSSEFIRSHAKRFLVMTDHTVKQSRKLLLSYCLKITADFKLPSEWAAMMFLISQRGFPKKKTNKAESGEPTATQEEEGDDDESIEITADVKACASFVVLLKLVYGLNDEMFAVLLNRQLITDAKELLDEAQHRFLVTVVSHLSLTKFRKTTSFYQSCVPSFSSIAGSIAEFIQREETESFVDVHDYKQLESASSQNLLLLIASFVDQRKRQLVLDKIKGSNTMNNQNPSEIGGASQFSQQTAQMKYDDLEDEIPFIQQIRQHISNSPSTSSTTSPHASNCSVERKFDFIIRQGYRKFSGCLASDLEYMASEVIKKGKSLIPPSYDYEMEPKNVASAMSNMSLESAFIVNNLAKYLGFTTSPAKLLVFVHKLEIRVHASLTKKDKKLPPTDKKHLSFIEAIAQSLA